MPSRTAKHESRTRSSPLASTLLALTSDSDSVRAQSPSSDVGPRGPDDLGDPHCRQETEHLYELTTASLDHLIELTEQLQNLSISISPRRRTHPNSSLVASNLVAATNLFSPLSDGLPSLDQLPDALFRSFPVQIPINKLCYAHYTDHLPTVTVAEDYVPTSVHPDTCHSVSVHFESALDATLTASLLNASAGNQGGTEAYYQYSIDTFIYAAFGLARAYLNLPINFDRNKADGSGATKPQLRPDFVCWVNKKLVFKGEEKKSGDVHVVANELVDKMMKGTGLLPYLLCYASAGTTIQFAAIDSKHKLHFIGDTLDISKPQGRFYVMRAMVNVIRILRTAVARSPARQ